ncbi:MAG: hypothetical protein GX416_10540 [Bacteroidales bacterium]|nr:hypothetical protein [Bacteroidales bacterium]
MKTLKFFGIASLVVLASVFTSCSKSNDSSSEITKGDDDGGVKKAPTTDELFAKYIGNYSNITCRTRFTPYGSIQFYLLGIKNKHLWFSQFDSSNGTLKQTWEDTEETDSVLKINKGYGEYGTFQIQSIIPGAQGLNFYKKTDTGNITFLLLSGKWKDASNFCNVAYTVFTSNNKSKHIISCSHADYSYIYLNDWYENSAIIDGCCYSQSGDTLYVCKDNYGPSLDYVPVSYEEGIVCSSYYNNIYRNNFKTGEKVWGTEIKAPFDVPTDANPKYTYTLLDKSTDIWKYKVNMVYYDGTKKEFTFTININTGEYKASV